MINLSDEYTEGVMSVRTRLADVSRATISPRPFARLQGALRRVACDRLGVMSGGARESTRIREEAMPWRQCSSKLTA